MRKKLLVLGLAGFVSMMPVAATSDSDELLEAWYKAQYHIQSASLEAELHTYAVIEFSKFLYDSGEVEQYVRNQIEVTNLITSTAKEIESYAHSQKKRLELVKSSLHMNEIEKYKQHTKHETPDEIDEELTSYFNEHYLDKE